MCKCARHRPRREAGTRRRRGASVVATGRRHRVERAPAVVVAFQRIRVSDSCARQTHRCEALTLTLKWSSLIKASALAQERSSRVECSRSTGGLKCLLGTLPIRTVYPRHSNYNAAVLAHADC